MTEQPIEQGAVPGGRRAGQQRPRSRAVDIQIARATLHGVGDVVAKRAEDAGVLDGAAVQDSPPSMLEAVALLEQNLVDRRRQPDDVARPPASPHYHEAIELIGRPWTGAIVSALVHHTTLRFGEIADSVPELSYRLLSERMKELETRGVVVRTVLPGRPMRVEYELSAMGRELGPAVRELEAWARRWLADRERDPVQDVEPERQP